MHAGYAISVLDTEEAEETLRLLQQIAEADADE
jgi:hydrogenase maturation factor